MHVLLLALLACGGGSGDPPPNAVLADPGTPTPQQAHDNAAALHADPDAPADEAHREAAHQLHEADEGRQEHRRQGN